MSQQTAKRAKLTTNACAILSAGADSDDCEAANVCFEIFNYAASLLQARAPA
jgi:hypothetical protein